MTDFQRDFEVLINEGVFAAKNDRIRFVFRYGNRLNGEVKALDLGERAYNCLRRSKIDTIEMVAEKWDELGRMKQAGAKTVKEIKNKYLQFYYNTLDDEERKDFWRDTVEATITM